MGNTGKKSIGKRSVEERHVMESTLGAAADPFFTVRISGHLGIKSIEARRPMLRFRFWSDGVLESR